MDLTRWTTVSDTRHDHEREALAWLRGQLPNRDPYRVWSNFEFLAGDGRLYEVDVLVIAPTGVYLIEVKSHPGTISGDDHTWRWTRAGGSASQFDNPYRLANRKARALAAGLNSTRAFAGRADRPFVSALVFLSDPGLTVQLTPPGRTSVYGRDPDPGQQLPPGRAAIGGVVAHLTGRDEPTGQPRRRIDRPLGDRVTKAVEQVNIRERNDRRLVGDYHLGALLHDADPAADNGAGGGIVYQDFLGQHRTAANISHRLRIYPLELNATAEARQAAERAARREFELLHHLDHPGIVRPIGLTNHDRGPVLIFDHDPEEVTLEAFLTDPLHRDTLTVAQRLDLLRQLTEAVGYAHQHEVFHRALSPSAVLVRRGAEPGTLRARITSWHAGARIAHRGQDEAAPSPGSGSGTQGTAAATTSLSGTLHLDALAASDTLLYRAPEAAQPKADPVRLDVFSLGAVGLFILTGQPPAGSPHQLARQLATAGCLDPGVVADGFDTTLVDLIQQATMADPDRRIRDTPDLLAYLDLVEESWNVSPVDEPDPLAARRGDRLHDDRFEVLHRLGRGATAVALLVRDQANQSRLCVLKVAEDPAHNDRLLDEAAALADLHHPNIVSLLEDPLELAGHATLVLSYAGPRIDPDADPTSTSTSRPQGQDHDRDRTLAARLAHGPVGVELAERWGTDLLDAVRYLEQMGRPHRDIKPDNLSVCPRGENHQLHLVLFDFSLSLVPADRIDAGTPSYRDPFLAKRGRWDLAAERYSAAVVLFELTTGTRPRHGDGRADPVMVGAEPVLEPGQFDAAVAPGLLRFFRRALAPDAADRFDTADDMHFAWHEAFRPAAEPATPSIHPPARPGDPFTPTFPGGPGAGMAEAGFAVPAGTTAATPLAQLPLARRALSALEAADILTVGELLAASPLAFNRRGVGPKTKAEIREALGALRGALGRAGPPTEATQIGTTQTQATPTAAQPPEATATQATPTEAQPREDSPTAAQPREDKPTEPTPSYVVAGRDERPRLGPEPERGPEAEPEAEPGSLLALALAFVPPARRANQATQTALARRLLGIEGPDPWASQADLGESLHVTPARVSQLFGSLRARWAESRDMAELRRQIGAVLGASGGVATAEQIASRLAAAWPRAGDPQHHALLAAGLVRVATLVAEGDAAGEAATPDAAEAAGGPPLPRWLLRRTDPAATVLLAALPAAAGTDSTEPDGTSLAGADTEGPDAQALADYALALGAKAAFLIAEQAVVPRRELLDHLQRVAPPSGAAPLPPAHLADLAAALCAGAAVNSRMELYPTGLTPRAALEAARRAFVGLNVTPDDVLAKLRARFPDAKALRAGAAPPWPDRTELDRALAKAGLAWDAATGRYAPPPPSPAATSLGATSLTPYATDVPAVVPAVEVDIAADFERRLATAVDSGGLLVLVTEPAELDNAARQLERLAGLVVDVDAWLVEEIRTVTAGGRPSWELVLAADAAGPGTADWANLQRVISPVLDAFTARLAGTAGTVALTNLGLLARYDRLDKVAAWRDLLHAGAHPLRALWLLVPSGAAADVPLLDGRAVPVISRNEWSQIPPAWLRNTHRVGAPR